MRIRSLSTFRRRGIVLSLVTILASANVPTWAAQQRISSPCRSVLGNAVYPRDYVFSRNTHFDSNARAVLNRELRPTVAVLSFVPETGVEYSRVYGRQPSAAVSKELDKNLAFTAAKLPLARHYARVGRNNFESTLASIKENVVIIVGHNDRGTFRFLDGTSESVTELAESVGKYGKLPVFVSCRAAEFVSGTGVGTKTVLTSVAGLMIADQLSRSLGENPLRKVSVDSLATTTARFESSVNTKLMVNYMVIRGCHIGGLVVAALLICMAVDDDIC